MNLFRGVNVRRKRIRSSHSETEAETAEKRIASQAEVKPSTPRMTISPSSKELYDEYNMISHHLDTNSCTETDMDSIDADNSRSGTDNDIVSINSLTGNDSVIEDVFFDETGERSDREVITKAPLSLSHLPPAVTVTTHMPPVTSFLSTRKYTPSYSSINHPHPISYPAFHHSRYVSSRPMFNIPPTDIDTSLPLRRAILNDDQLFPNRLLDSNATHSAPNTPSPPSTSPFPSIHNSLEYGQSD